MGIGYGPIVVTRDEVGVEALREREIVIPGRLTTAYLALRLALGDDVARARAAVRPRSSTRSPPAAPTPAC